MHSALICLIIVNLFVNNGESTGQCIGHNVSGCNPNNHCCPVLNCHHKPDGTYKCLYGNCLGSSRPCNPIYDDCYYGLTCLLNHATIGTDAPACQPCKTQDDKCSKPADCCVGVDCTGNRCLSPTSLPPHHSSL